MNMTKERCYLVYADWYMFEKARIVGTLCFSQIRGKALYSFEYNQEWLLNGIQIDPRLPLFPGKHFSGSGYNFGIFQDSSPDRWGQMLMKRREILQARKANRSVNTLFDIDFLIGVHDLHRIGGLRIKEDVTGPFLSNDSHLSTPPWASLRELEHAVNQYEKDGDHVTQHTLKWINQLFAPGSSLGGARPKADVKDSENRQWVAKFPSRSDQADVGLWELLVHDLAKRAGILVPNALVMKLNSQYHTFLSQRFDRTIQGKRIHYCSAMTMLGAKDGDDADSGISYLDLAATIKTSCADVNQNLEELFRRVLFSVYVSNTDDHLRNHGFILTESGLTLSPAFDLNANETGTGLTLNIDEHDNELSVPLVLSTASHYHLSEEKANSINLQVKNAVSDWRKSARLLKIPNAAVSQKERAFERSTG